MTITTGIELKLGMIKASGYHVSVMFNNVTNQWDITIGNEKTTAKSIDDVLGYVNIKYKEIVQND